MKLTCRACMSCCLLMVFLFTNSLYAKTLTQQDNEKQKFWKLSQAVYQGLQQLPEASLDVKDSHVIFTQSCSTPAPALYRAESLRSEAEMLEKNWGVELRGRLTSESLQSGEDDDGSRGYIELSWNVLRNGLKQNNDNAEVLYRKAELLELQEKANKIIRKQRCIRYALDKAFVAYSSRVLTLKLELLESIYAVERRAYFKGWNRFDDLVVSDSELKLARHELNYLHSSPYFDEAILDVQNPPNIDIDMAKLILAIRENSDRLDSSQLQKEILKQEKLASDDNQLRFFVRDSLIHDESFEPADVVVGLNFIVPFTRDSDKPLLNSIKALDEQERMQEWERLLKVRDAYDQVRFQQKQLIKQKARFLRAYERIRQTIAEINLGNRELLPVALTRLRTALDAAFELIQVKQSLYLKINQVFVAAGIQIQPEYIRLFDTEYARNKSRQGERSLYVWSATFNAYPNQQVFDFLAAKGIREVYLSAGKKTDADKLNNFISEAGNTQISVTTVIGANEWIYPAKHQMAAVHSAVAIEKSQRLHLDIEPHTLSGYHAHREQYLKHYLTMIRRVRKAIGDSFLSVSVPSNWPPTIYQQLANYVDRINIMAYGSGNLDKIHRQVQKVLKKVPADKLVIVLNMADFSDAWAVEQTIEQLQSRTSVNRFAYHSFKSFLAFSSNP